MIRKSIRSRLISGVLAGLVAIMPLSSSMMNAGAAKQQYSVYLQNVDLNIDFGNNCIGNPYTAPVVNSCKASNSGMPLDTGVMSALHTVNGETVTMTEGDVYTADEGSTSGKYIYEFIVYAPEDFTFASSCTYTVNGENISSQPYGYIWHTSDLFTSTDGMNYIFVYAEAMIETEEISAELIEDEIWYENGQKTVDLDLRLRGSIDSSKGAFEYTWYILGSDGKKYLTTESGSSRSTPKFSYDGYTYYRGSGKGLDQTFNNEKFVCRIAQGGRLICYSDPITTMVRKTSMDNGINVFTESLKAGMPLPEASEFIRMYSSADIDERLREQLEITHVDLYNNATSELLKSTEPLAGQTTYDLKIYLKVPTERLSSSLDYQTIKDNGVYLNSEKTEYPFATEDITPVTATDPITSEGYEYNFYVTVSFTTKDEVSTELIDGIFEYYINKTQNFAILSGVIPQETYTGSGGDALVYQNKVKNFVIPSAVKAADGKYYPVVSLGDAFHHSTSLQTISYEVTKDDEGSEIPFQLNSIGYDAFEYCDGLTSVELPDSVTKICSGAFFSCTHLSSFDIPASLKTIGDSAFCKCECLNSMNFLTDAPDLETIGRNAFNGANSVSLKFGDKVTEIGDYAFANNTSLTTFTLYSDAAIGEGVFAGDEDLEFVTLNGNAKVTDDLFADLKSVESLTVIRGLSDEFCSMIRNTPSLSTLDLGGKSIPDSDVAEIPAMAFMNCTNIQYITFRPGIESIGSLAFYGSGINKASIPYSVTSIGDAVFANCENITSADLTYTQLTTIPDDMFGNCVNLTGIVKLPNNITSIGNNAFINTAITGINIPAGVTSIGDSAFCGCTSLADVTFAEGSELETIGDNAFCNDEALTAISIPAGVTSIGASAFCGCSSLADVTFAEGAELETIGVNAFCNDEALTAISIPAGVTSIGDSAFCGCTSLADVTFAEGSELETIGENAFCNDEALTAISIPAGVTSIGDSAFYGCTSLADATFAEGSELETIGDNAFCNDEALTAISIPAGVTSIGDSAFYGCTSLADATFAEGSELKSIGSYAFYNDPGIKEITLPETLTAIGDHAFEATKATFYIPKTDITFGIDAFADSADALLYVYKNSTAHKYAVDNDINYRLYVELGDYTIAFDSESVPYNGSPIRLAYKLYDSDGSVFNYDANFLTEVYTDDTAVGEATLTLIGIGHYLGEVSGHFTITWNCDLLGHEEVGEWIIGSAATCNSTGTKYQLCKHCGAQINETVIPVDPDAHNFTFTSTVEPTEEENGYDIYSCGFCGATSTTNVVPALIKTTSTTTDTVSTTTQDDSTTTSASETTTAAEKTTTSAAESVTTTASAKTTTSAAESVTTTASDKTTTSAAESATTTASDKTTTSAAESATTTAAEKTTTSAAASETTTAAEKTTTSAAASETTTAAEKTTTSAAASETTTAAEKTTTSAAETTTSAETQTTSPAESTTAAGTTTGAVVTTTAEKSAVTLDIGISGKTFGLTGKTADGTDVSFESGDITGVAEADLINGSGTELVFVNSGGRVQLHVADGYYTLNEKGTDKVLTFRVADGVILENSTSNAEYSTEIVDGVLIITEKSSETETTAVQTETVVTTTTTAAVESGETTSAAQETTIVTETEVTTTTVQETTTAAETETTTAQASTTATETDATTTTAKESTTATETDVTTTTAKESTTATETDVTTTTAKESTTAAETDVTTTTAKESTTVTETDVTTTAKESTTATETDVTTTTAKESTTVTETDVTTTTAKESTSTETGVSTTSSAETSTQTQNETTAGEGETVTTTSPETEEVPLGDFNGDGFIDSADASLILVMNANGDELTPEQIAAGDVNGDGMVDPVDASLILVYNAYVAGGGKETIFDWFKTIE